MFLVVEEQDSTCSRLNPSLLFISKGRDLKAKGTRHVILKKPILVTRA